MQVTVTLNGTTTNPWRRYGLKRNPFPQCARAEFAALDDALAELDGEPMPFFGDLVRRLDRLGASAQFRAACIENYRQGERARFTISFPDARDEVAS